MNGDKNLKVYVQNITLTILGVELSNFVYVFMYIYMYGYAHAQKCAFAMFP